MPATIKVKMVYFDRQIIKYNWHRINRMPLVRAGLYVRKIARNSIRRRPYGRTSLPGSAPFSHKPGNTPPFKMIYSVPDMFHTRVTIGMVGFGNALTAVPGLHEHGGSATRLVNTPKQLELRKQIKRSIAKRKASGKPKSKLSPARAIAVKKLLKPQLGTASYRARPFMWPALARAQPMISSFWYKSFSHRTVLSKARTLPHVYSPTRFVKRSLL